MNTFYRGDDGRVHSLGENNELRHWKYIKKIPVGQGFRYFYSWDEYRAYLADPTAELQKTGQKAANQLQSAGRQAGKDVRSAGRSAQKQISKGRNKVERAIKTADRSKMTVSGVKQANASKPESTRKRLNDLAKKVSQKWNSNKEAAKESIKNGKKWFDEHLNPIAKYKKRQEEKRRQEEEARKKYEEKRETLAKKYKYLHKETINGRTRYFYSQDEIDAYKKKQQYIENEPAFMSDVKKSKDPYTREEDAMLVNPNLESFDSDYSYNCAECTAIYELRRRGYDVESNGESGLGPNAEKYNTEKRFDLFYEDADTHHIKPSESKEAYAKQLEKEFEQYPPGSRGDISFKWDGVNSAHSIAWEKDSDGKVHFVDTQQSGGGNQTEYQYDNFSDIAGIMDTTYTKKQRVKGKIFKQDVGYTAVTRTDNLELKPEIKKICKNSTEDRPSVNTETPNQFSAKGGRLSKKNAYGTKYRMSEKEAVTKYPNLLDHQSYREVRENWEDVSDYSYTERSKK